MEAYFLRTGRVMSENNRKQALMPEGAVVFQNENGTAPGAAIELSLIHISRRKEREIRAAIRPAQKCNALYG